MYVVCSVTVCTILLLRPQLFALIGPALLGLFCIDEYPTYCTYCSAIDDTQFRYFGNFSYLGESPLRLSHCLSWNTHAKSEWMWVSLMLQGVWLLTVRLRGCGEWMMEAPTRRGSRSCLAGSRRLHRLRPALPLPSPVRIVFKTCLSAAHSASWKRLKTRTRSRVSRSVSSHTPIAPRPASMSPACPLPRSMPTPRDSRLHRRPRVGGPHFPLQAHIASLSRTRMTSVVEGTVGYIPERMWKSWCALSLCYALLG